MSNLGMYQTMTTAAKRVKGPFNLALIIATTGYAIGKVCEAVVKAAYKKRCENCVEKNEKIKLHEVKGIYSSRDGLELMVGDRVVILEQLEDAALIEKIGDDNNPHIIPISVLQDITELK